MQGKFLRIAALLAALSLILAACGDSTEDTTAATSGPDATTAAGDDTPDPTTGGDDTPTTMAAVTGVPDSPDDGVTSDKIVLGFMGDITGPTAATQDFFNAGIAAYVDFVNENGGVLDRELELVTKDDTYAVEPALTNFRSLVDDEKVLAILGQGGSHIMTAIDQDISDAGVPFIGQQQTIDIQLDNPLVFNTLAHYGDQADIAVARMAEQLGGYENLVVVSVGLEVASGEEWGVYVGDAATTNGATYAGHIRIPIQGSEADAQAIEIKQLIETEGVNYIALHSSPSAVLRLMNSMVKLEVDLPIGGISAVIAENVYAEGPAELLDTFWGVTTYTPPSISTPGNDEMNAWVAGTQYEEKSTNTNFVGGWVVGKLAVEAIHRAADSGSVTRATLIDALTNLSGFDTGGQSPVMDCTREGQHCGVAARPYDWDGTTLVPVGVYEDWIGAIDFNYGLGG